jgi:hypothetical protein
MVHTANDGQEALDRRGETPRWEVGHIKEGAHICRNRVKAARAYNNQALANSAPKNWREITFSWAAR